MGSFTNRTGEKHLTNEGYRIEIIEYRGNKDCDIQFENGTILMNICYHHIKNRNVKNPYHPSVQGIGYFGVGKYIAKTKGKNTKLYEVWNKMMQRCYNGKIHNTHPTYKDCSVAQEWLNFQTFGDWFEENYVEGFVLDKDILLKRNKIYSKDTCCFVPQEINGLFVKSDSVRGKYPIGVYKRGNKFVAQLNSNRERILLGYFKTPEKAFQAYKKAKEKEIKDYARVCKSIIIKEVYNALINYKVEITD